jgi:hypothetical protein
MDPDHRVGATSGGEYEKRPWGTVNDELGVSCVRLPGFVQANMHARVAPRQWCSMMHAFIVVRIVILLFDSITLQLNLSETIVRFYKVDVRFYDSEISIHGVQSYHRGFDAIRNHDSNNFLHLSPRVATGGEEGELMPTAITSPLD